MENIFYIYAHINPIKNEIFYIGKGSKNRAFDNSRRSNYWNRITKKYNLIVDILEDNLTEEEAFERERWYIKRLGRKNIKTGKLVNFTDGGEGQSGRICSDETKKKMSLTRKGKPSPRKGAKLSDETKKKVSESKKGKKLSEDHKIKIRNSCINNNKGRKMTQEHKDKIGLIHKNKPWSVARRLAELTKNNKTKLN